MVKNAEKVFFKGRRVYSPQDIILKTVNTKSTLTVDKRNFNERRKLL